MTLANVWYIPDGMSGHLAVQTKEAIARYVAQASKNACLFIMSDEIDLPDEPTLEALLKKAGERAHRKPKVGDFIEVGGTFWVVAPVGLFSLNTTLALDGDRATHLYVDDRYIGKL